MISLLLALCALWAPRAVNDLQATLDQATKAFEAGDYAAALEGFRAVEPTIVQAGDNPVFRWNIARCLEELGRPDEAIAAFEAYLILPDTPENHAEAQTRVAGIRARFFGTVDVTCAPADMRFDVEGTQAPSRACPVRLEDLRAGRYVLVGTTPDGREARRVVEVRAGVEQAVRLALPGRVRVGSTPPGAVSLDGRAVGRTPLVLDAVEAGRRTVAVQVPGHAVWSQTVEVPPDGDVTVRAQPLPLEGPGPDWAAWTAGGAAAATLATGAVLFFQAQGAFDDAEAAQRRYDAATDPTAASSARADAETARDDGRLMRTASLATLGIGVGLAGVATWLFLRDGSSAQAPAAAAGASAFQVRF